MTTKTKTEAKATTSLTPTRADIRKEIKTLQKNIGTLRERVQKIIVMIVEHALSLGSDGKPIGDVSLFNEFLTCEGLGIVRRKLIIDHVSAYTPIVIEPKGGSFNARIAKQGPNFKPFDVDGLRDNKWYNSKAVEQDPELLTFENIAADMQKLADRFAKWVKDGKIDDADKPAALAASSWLRSFKFDKPAAASNESSPSETQETDQTAEDQPLSNAA